MVGSEKELSSMTTTNPSEAAKQRARETCQHCEQLITEATTTGGGWVHMKTGLATCRKLGTSIHEGIFNAEPIEPDIYDAIRELRDRAAIPAQESFTDTGSIVQVLEDNRRWWSELSFNLAAGSVTDFQRLAFAARAAQCQKAIDRLASELSAKDAEIERLGAALNEAAMRHHSLAQHGGDWRECEWALCVEFKTAHAGTGDFSTTARRDAIRECVEKVKTVPAVLFDSEVTGWVDREDALEALEFLLNDKERHESI